MGKWSALIRFMLLMALAPTHPVIAGTPADAGWNPLNCDVGPVNKTYGSAPWLVYSCHDDRSLTFVSAPGSPAMPFYFVLYVKEGQYRLTGEGTGDKKVTDAALAELQKLSATDVAALIVETKKVKPVPTAVGPYGLKCNIGPANEVLGGVSWHVYACDDGKTIGMTVAPETTALPLYYFFYLIDGHYQLQPPPAPWHDERVTQAGQAALQQLSDTDVVRLMGEAKQAKQSMVVSGNRIHDTIIGSWVYSDKRGDNSLTFDADGTFHGTLSRRGKIVWSYAGTWTVTDDVITYVYARSDPGLVPVGTIDIDTVLNLTENCFTLESVSTELSRVCRAP
ncbi:MAG TPA: lipocalin family protein [Gammaproteobacteria bacterium]|nr:lipocalin family protein [Gammaproteobacteria bacterium]